MRLEIRPERTTQVNKPINVVIEGADVKPRALVVDPSGIRVPLGFRLEGDSSWVAEFNPPRAGEYHVEVAEISGGGRESFSVAPSRNLDFTTEFGIFYGVAGVLILGLWIWSQRRWKRRWFAKI